MSHGSAQAEPPTAPTLVVAAAGGATVTQVAAGVAHTCALLDTGAVRCWGLGGYGQLGYGNTNNIGDDETPASAGDVDVGGTVTQIAAGGYHTCALLDSGAVRCWGWGVVGQLGYGNTNNIGDDETPASVGDVDVGGTVTQVAIGWSHTCALLDTGAVRCWGEGGRGRLGYGNTDNIGNNETPASAGDVDVGGTVAQVAAGVYHTCALLDTGAVRCWGRGDFGPLGYGNTNDIGDDETPASAGDVDVGGTVTQIAADGYRTCALLDTGAVRCWGSGAYGQLGYGNTNRIGDDETPASVGDVNVGGTVAQIAAGGYHTCPLLDTGAVRCWGYGTFGQLGYGNTNHIGDDETPASAGDVDVGGTVAQVTAGDEYSCALLDSGAVRCWGYGFGGRLGYGNTNNIGDDETPTSAGDVEVLGVLPPPDLSVTKVDSPAPLNALRPLTYTVTVTNNGPQEATGVTLTDTLPAGVSFNSATPTQGSCDENAGVVTCGLGPLADGASATVTIVVAPQSEGTIENTVSVIANEADPDTGDNTASTQTTVNPAPVPVPSLTQWGLIGMAGTFAVLLLVMVGMLGRRKAGTP